MSRSVHAGEGLRLRAGASMPVRRNGREHERACWRSRHAGEEQPPTGHSGKEEHW
jgi:hypothetical protein